MLYCAYRIMNDTHSSFTFVLVITGLAILLYGTGTQGAGTFDSQVDRNKYSIQMAGGAGILTLVIAFGVVHFSSDIKAAFQEQTRYVKAIVVPDSAEGRRATFDGYIGEFYYEGNALPAYRDGDVFYVLIPYRAGREALSMNIEARIHYVSKSKPRFGYLKLEHTQPLEVKFATNVDLDHGTGHDIPKIRGYFPLYITDSEKESTSFSDLQKIELETLPPGATVVVPDNFSKSMPAVN